MESNDKLKEIDIKNRTCYYFNDIIKIEDFDRDNTLIDKLYVCIRFNKVDLIEFMIGLDI